MDIKLIFSVAGVILILGGNVPYFVGIFRGKTRPHIYSWLIWTITYGIGLLGVIKGNGGWGSLSLAVGFSIVCITFLACFKYGSKNITKFDTVTLIFALLAIVVYFQLHNPLLAVFMVTLIDFIAYVPSFRKSFYEPYSENVASWVIYTIAGLLIILSLYEYNLLTLTYLVVTEVANIILIAICLARRKSKI
ncbi:MAG: hypothetical protein NTW11_01940 [Candidatus Staskawiczbacteria bacterium]|nr:hypothetical protein [Candidatus Staskawiczbacteria bacterium]